MTDDGAAAAAVAALALVHVLAGRLRFLESIPRSRWLSFAGGLSVAYVFARLLPELGEAQARLEAGAGGALPFLEHHAYLLALAGLAVFYGLERASHASRGRRRAREGRDETGSAAFTLSIAVYALYSALIGYVVAEEERSRLDLALFTLALGLHFVVNDFGLREHHRRRYDRVGRWLLAASLAAGWAVALVAEVSETALVVLLAFIAGGIILNVLKEELPERRQSRFLPFALGAAGYAALLQVG